MAIKYVKGNIIDLAEQGHFDVIIHGCNCFNTMGAGLAKEIKQRYPAAYEVDLKTSRGSKDKLGNFTFVKVQSPIKDHEFFIINLYTQFHYAWHKDQSKDLFEYEHFDKGLIRVSDFILSRTLDGNPLKVGLPLIGCGLAGGNKDKIISAIGKCLISPTIVVF
jgi:O-acetyl-ADP-ribose deacetylase (regulator of RNase III)